MTEMCFRMKDDGKIDIDRDHIERIQEYQQSKTRRPEIGSISIFREPLFGEFGSGEG